MSKLHHRKFARFFPSYHPRAWEPTYFVEKIWKWYYDAHDGDVRDLLYYNEKYDEAFGIEAMQNVHKFEPKHHTIRAGHHVKPGDYVRPSVWSGKPYHSKQIIIGPDIEVVKTWDFEIKINGPEMDVLLNNEVIYYHSVNSLGGSDVINQIPQNDGLSLIDFINWFHGFEKPFTGQIICWNKSIEY